MKLASKFGLAILLILFGVCDVHAQGAAHYQDVATTNIGGVLHVISLATIRLCTSGATGTPCTPTVQAYSDLALTHPLPTPFNADKNGNYNFYVAPGTYQLQISSLGVATQTLANLQLGVGGAGGTPGGSPTDCQSNQSGSFYGDAGCTYTIATQSLGGQSGFLITPSQAAAFAAPTVTPNTPASTGYCYIIVAFKGIVPIAISAQTCITNGPATIDSSHTISLGWAAVAGALNYSAWRSENPYNGSLDVVPQRGIVCSVTPPTISCVDNLTTAVGPQGPPFESLGGTGITGPLILGDAYPTLPRAFIPDSGNFQGPSLQVLQNFRGVPAIISSGSEGDAGGAFGTIITVPGGGGYGLGGGAGYYGSAPFTGVMNGIFANAGSFGTGSVATANAAQFEIDNENSGQVGVAAALDIGVPLIVSPATPSTTTIHKGIQIEDQSQNGVTSYGIHFLQQVNNGASHPMIAFDGATSGTTAFAFPATGGGTVTFPSGSGTVCYTSTCSGGSSAWSALTASTNSNSGSFISTGNTWDFSGVILFKARASAGLTTTVAGDFGYDTTNHNWHAFNNATDLLIPEVPIGTAVNGDCPTWVVSSGNVRLGDAGAPCGGAVTSVFGRTSAVVATSGDYNLSQIAAGAAPTGTFDFSGVTLFKGRSAAGLSTSVNGDFGYDTTNKNWRFWDNGVDSIAAIFSGSLTNGHCTQIQVSGGTTNVIDSGAVCGAGGGGGSGLTSVTSTSQTGSLASLSVVASTASTGLWVFTASVNVTAFTGSPTVTVGIPLVAGTCIAATGSIAGTGNVYAGFESSTGVPCNPTLINSGSAINANTTVSLPGGATISYTLTINAQMVGGVNGVSWSGITNGTNANAGTFTSTGNTWDFSGVTQFKGRVGSGLTTSANGDFGYDTTNKNWHVWDNATDSLMAVFSGALTNGHCANISVVSGVTSITDAGAACGSGGGGSGTVTSIVFSAPLTGSTITTTGTVGCPTCLISGASLTNNQLIFGAGGQSAAVGNLTGDVTTAGGKTTTLTNIPTGVTMAGFLTVTNVTAPATPAAGHVQIWTDSTNAILSSKNAAGTVSNTVVPSTLASHNFATGISATGVISGAQPAFTDISGQISFGQFPTPSTNGDVPCVASLAWTECTLGAPVVAKTLGYTFVQGDNGNIFTISDTSASTFTLSAASGFSGGYRTALLNINTGLATLSGSVNGGSTQIVPQNWFAPIYNNGTVWFAPTMPTFAAFPGCLDTSGNHLNFSTTTGAITCGTSSSGGSGITGLTTGFFPKAASSTSIANSLCDEGVTTANVFTCGDTAGAKFVSVATGTSPPTCTPGTAGAECFTEGTAPIAVASVEDVWGDATTHTLMAHANGGSPSMVVLSLPGSIHSTGNTAAISTATLCASSAGACNQAGTYNVHWAFIEAGTACSVPATGGVTFLLTWTDSNGTTHSGISLAMDDGSAVNAVSGTFHFQTSLAAAWASGDFSVDSNGGIIQYATGYTACGTGTGNYTLNVSVTRLQ